MERLPAALLGATGMTGQMFIRCLEDHPYFELKVLTASQSNAGKPYREAAKWYVEGDIPASVADLRVVETTVEAVLNEADVKVVFCGLPSGVAKPLEPEFARQGRHVFSDAGCFRTDPDVPVIIGEVNGDHLALLQRQRQQRPWPGSIVKNSNCTVIGTAMVLKPLLPFGVKQVYLSSMQAVSGAGYDGVPSMAILDNVIPYIVGEEEKVETEAVMMLGTLDEEACEVRDHPMFFSASCHRVATLYGHIVALFIEFEQEVDMNEIKAAIREFRGLPQELELPTAPRQPLVLFDDDQPFRPQVRLDRHLGEPARAAGMATAVGRVRHDHTKNRIKLINLAHNTIRGASANAVLTAELAVRQGWI
jgi:aspartate-semialdehyde dehydrogenase